MTVTLARIYRYPVKGLTAEPLESVELEAGKTIAGDRRFALAHGATAAEGWHSGWHPKTAFLTLMRNPRLARLRSRYEEDTGVLVIERDGKPVARGAVTEPAGRAVIEGFFKAFLGEEVRGTPRLTEARDQPFTDTDAGLLSLVNLASVLDLERVARAPLDPLRFRANLYIDGAPAWREFTWVGRTLRLGEARLRVVERIERCAATEVDPETGTRDVNVSRALASGFGHVDLGVLAEVVRGGRVAADAALAADDGPDL